MCCLSEAEINIYNRSLQALLSSHVVRGNWGNRGTGATRGTAWDNRWKRGNKGNRGNREKRGNKGNTGNRGNWYLEQILVMYLKSE